MYAADLPYSEIKIETGKGEDEVQRLVKRCLTAAPDGMIYGFQALVPGTRLSTYARNAPLRNGNSCSNSSYTGALGQLFSRFPEIKDLVDNSYLNRVGRGEMGEQQKPITKIHASFKAALIKLGFSQNDWPFSTDNCGYKALAKYCANLRLSETQEAALSRSGEEAARRGKIGKGIKSLIIARRPYGYVQLDFHKIDSASTILIKNDFGVEQEINVNRWHIGLLADEYSSGILGAYIALEKTPSGDSTLEVIESAVRPTTLNERSADPRYALLSGKQVLIHELLPELEFQCFSVLKVDNGWSNAANEVVNNIMDTVGCAVNFGPVRAWWRRNLIERIFLELTTRGLQRLPSSYGSGRGDTRVSKPNENAAKFKIRISDLASIIYGYIHTHNVEVNEGRQWSAPLQVIQSALQHDQAGFFAKPLPLAKQYSQQLLTHEEIVTVRGSAESNERPYFINDRWRYTNEKLANSPWLVNKKLIIYVNRRLCRVVHATVQETGERLGQMFPPGKWAESKLSWRDRKLINRAGQRVRNQYTTEDPYDEYKTKKARDSQEKTKPKSKKFRSSTDALDLARLSMAESRDVKSQIAAIGDSVPASQRSTNELANFSMTEQRSANQQTLRQAKTEMEKPVEQSKHENPKPRADPFGLNLVPTIFSVKKG